MDLIDKYIGESEDYGNEIDRWLQKNGWKETHGIALYTHKKYPGVGIDTNSGDASIEACKDIKSCHNFEGAHVDYTSDLNRVKKSIIYADIQIKLFHALKKKYGKGASSHLTTDHIAFYRKNPKPSIQIYLDSKKSIGKIIVGDGRDGQYKIISLNKNSVKEAIPKIEELLVTHDALKSI